MMLIDSHCHLDMSDYESDLEETLERAAQAGIGLMTVIGTRLDKADQALALVDRYDNLYCTVGVHPHEVSSEADFDARRLIELAQHPKVIGFGETGLDYFYDLSPRPQQQAAFRIHIQASREAGLPFIVHTRDADQDTIDILTSEAAHGPFTGLIHCFSSGRALAETALELGLYLSLSGIITFPKSEDLRQIVRDMPLDRLLVETDAPYLSAGSSPRLAERTIVRCLYSQQTR